jgi:predicted flap endonuclease-1-like 5' DNA nuclease
MLKSEMFEVHNIRSKNDRAPDILSGLDEDVKLLKGVGRRAVEDLQKEGILQVWVLAAAEPRAL